MADLEQETILSRLIRMEEKLDGYLFRTVRTEDRVDDHEARIRNLETGAAKLLAGVALVGFVASAFGDSILRAFAG